MSWLLAFMQWLQMTSIPTAVREDFLPYPTILSLHLTAIAFLGGMILVTNLRLLGLAMRKRPVAEVIDQLRVPKIIAFLAVATCGVLLASSKAEEYYYNVFFWCKMSLLASIAVHWFIFRRDVYRNAAEMDRTGRIPGKAKLAASLSLILWMGVAICGRGIGYIEPPLDKLHAQVTAPVVLPVAAQLER